MRSRPLLLVVDAASLLHRHYHARAESRLLDRGGRPAWALHGMILQIIEAIGEFAPDAVLFGLDDREHSVRASIYPDYKGGRPAKDPELIEQLDRTPSLLSALGFVALTPPGLEADDVAASAAAWATRHDWNCVIVTSDRDSFAHISEHTSVLRLISGGIGGSPLLTPTRLHTMYGVRPDNYLDFAAVRGDASDNLPGIPGIGEKTAPVLLELTGSMTAVWADIEHCAGANLVATFDSWAEETGARKIGRSLLAKLTAPGARARYDFNIAMMTGHDDLDLPLPPAGPDRRGGLPLTASNVARVIDHFGVPSTTELALRVLCAKES